MLNLDKQKIFVLIPEEVMNELIQAIKDLKMLKETLEKGNNSDALGDYIPEEQAMELLDRGKTWFFNKRKSGELPGKKAAGRWYYKKEDIIKFIQNGRSI